MSSDEITVNINIPDKDIERLERVKQILEDIKKLDSNFSLSNVLNIDKESILVFTTSLTINKEDQHKIEKQLTEQFGIKCKLISDVISLEKAITIDYAKGKDYTTVTYYNDEGNLIKEETIQYK